MPGSKGIGVEIADVALLADEIDDVIRELHKAITFVGFRHLLNYPLVFIIDDHVCMNMHNICMKVFWPSEGTYLTPSQSADSG